MLRKRALSSNLSLALHSYSKCAELRSVLRRHSHAIALSPRRSKALPCSLAPAAYPRGIATQPQTICDRLFEEERLPGYDPDEFYPVYQGDTIKSRYRVIGKLGYGASSTVWFCRDLRYFITRLLRAALYGLTQGLRDYEYVVLKIYIRTSFGRTNREKAAYNHFADLNITQPEQYDVRQALDVFEIERPEGAVHVCLAHRPLQCTLYAFQRLGGAPRPLPEELAKIIMRSLLTALEFLHEETHVTHCGMASLPFFSRGCN